MFQLFSILLFACAISGCAHNPPAHQGNLKSVQVFRANSGANYIFVSQK